MATLNDSAYVMKTATEDPTFMLFIFILFTLYLMLYRVWVIYKVTKTNHDRKYLW